MGNEDLFRSIVDGLPALVSLMLPDGDVTFANRQLLQYLGLNLEELNERSLGATLHPDDREGAQAAWLAAVDAGSAYDFEARRRRADGVYRWFHMRGFPLQSPMERLSFGACCKPTPTIENGRRLVTPASGACSKWWRGVTRARRYLMHCAGLSKTPLGAVIAASC